MDKNAQRSGSGHVATRWRDAQETLRRFAPGLALSCIIAMAAGFLSDHHGGPTLLYALLLGMAFHFLSGDARFEKGVAFAARTVLRMGVALLGVRISAGKIAELGAAPIVLVLIGVPATLLVGRLLGPRLGLSSAQGVLTGGSVAICGASAALAISAALPQHRDTARETLFTVVSVTVLSTVAMVSYPLLTRALGFDDKAAGILLGLTIHDVAQVVGAGYLISEQAGVVATYVKLLRVSMLLPVVAAVAWGFPKDGPAGARTWNALPGFLVAFAVLAFINSAGLVSQNAADALGSASRWFLVCAIAALGLKTSLKDVAKVGWRPMLLIVVETLFLLLLALAGMRLAGL